MADDTAVEGPYVESEDHVPNATDMTMQYDTSGNGPSAGISEVAAIYEQDQLAVAEQIVAALDDDDDTVPASRVLFQDNSVDRETEKEEILAAANTRIEKGVTYGEPGPTEAAAAEESDDADADAGADEKTDDKADEKPAAKKTAAKSGAK